MISTPLNGALPPVLSDLPYLEELKFDTCGIIGLLEMRPFLAPNLSSLHLDQNELLGTIPPALFNLPRLKSLVLREPGLTGTLPSNMGESTNLEEFEFYSDRISGSIPESVSNMSQLTILRIASNSLGGGLPNGLEKLQSLVHLELEGFKNLRGGFPRAILELKHLKILTLYIPTLFGTIPSDLGKLSELQRLELSCPFEGTLPPSIGQLKDLQDIDLHGSRIVGPLPKEIGQLQSLTSFTAYDLIGQGLGQLPAEFGLLRNLVHISLPRSGLTGTLHPSILQLQHLYQVDLSFNQLTGSIPIFPPNVRMIQLEGNLFNGTLEEVARTDQHWNALSLSNNRLTGTIPNFVRPLTTLALDGNLLHGPLPEGAPASLCLRCIFSRNRLNGTIPSNVTSSTSLVEFQISSNQFNGTIPPQYAQIKTLEIFYAAKNKLSGNLEGWNIYPGDRNVRLSLDFSHNLLSGELPDLIARVNLDRLSLSGNQFEGPLPQFPIFIRHLDLSGNKLHGTMAMIDYLSELQFLDLSNNNFNGTLSGNILTSNLMHLNLAWNNLSGTIVLEPNQQYPTQVLDLSHNRLYGVLPDFGAFRSLVSLIISHNELEGGWPSGGLPLLTHLDFSNNKLAFDLSLLTLYQSMAILEGSNNLVSGCLSDLQALPALKMVDLSNNQLDRQFDLLGLKSLFEGSLKQLYIQGNPLIPSLLPTEYAGPWRTTQSQPSPSLPDFVNCFTLTFVPNRTSLYFDFDEKLFQWAQCDCMDGYYGIPSSTCYECPGDPSKCHDRLLSVPRNIYVYHISLDRVGSDHTTTTSQHAHDEDQPHKSLLQTEDCIDSLASTESNCKGLNFTTDQGASVTQIIEHFKDKNYDQCEQGSDGRLCSHCTCDLAHLSLLPPHHDSNSFGASNPTRTGSCYYKSGFRCKKCSRIFTPAQSVPFFIGIFLTILILSTGLMHIILRSKRQVRDKSWEELSIWHRIGYRLLNTSKSGFISILILFTQLLAAFTHLDSYIARSFAELLNGKLEGLGIDCLFPTLFTRPIVSLALQLVLPFVLALTIAASVGLAELLYRLTESKHRDHFDLVSDSDDSSMSIGLLSTQAPPANRMVEYSAIALVCSNTITILQFFYFGMSLTATEYFFASTQEHTGLKFVQAHPWMLYSEAGALRGLSIPWLVLVVFGFPLAFVIFAWQVRHKISSPKVISYVGSLFARYRLELFWWEIVNVMKKLTVALLLRGVSAANPLQAAFLSFVLAVPLIVQAAVRPWKRYWENVMDAVGGILLVCSLFISSTLRHARSFSAFYFILTLDSIFLFVLVAMILHNLITEKTEYQRIWETSFGKFDILDSDGLALTEDPSTSNRMRKRSMALMQTDNYTTNDYESAADDSSLED